MWNAGLDDSQAEIKIARKNINNFRYVDDTTLVAESKEELKGLLIRVKKESKKAGLKLNIQKTKIMASSPITSRQTDGETMETVTDFIFLASKITADGDCSHEIKRCLLIGRKAMANIDSILKSRDVTLPTKVHLVKAIVFPGVMYECESWTINKAESRKIDAFELWCWRRLLRVPWTARQIKPVNPKGNQSWIFIGRTDAEAPILWSPDLRANSLEKTWMLRKIEGRRRRGRQDEMVGWHHWPGGQGSLVCCIPWGCKELDTERLNWTKSWTTNFSLDRLL